MRGIRYQDLIAIVDFIYLGEANIQQENLEEFLSLAEELQLKGLAGPNDIKEQQTTKHTPSLHEQVTQSKNVIKKEEIKTNAEEPLEVYEHNTFENQVIVLVEHGKIVVKEGIINEDLEAKIESMIEKIRDGDKKFKCYVCGRTDKKNVHMKRHVETHIEGVSHVCNLCGKSSRSTTDLIDHHTTCHKIIPFVSVQAMDSENTRKIVTDDNSISSSSFG